METIIFAGPNALRVEAHPDTGFVSVTGGHVARGGVVSLCQRLDRVGDAAGAVWRHRDGAPAVGHVTIGNEPRIVGARFAVVENGDGVVAIAERVSP